MLKASQSVLSRFLFFPTKTLAVYPSRLETPYEEVHFKNDEGAFLYGWFFSGMRTDRTFCYLHGNAGNVADRLDKILTLRKIGNVFIFDYRGYGVSEGTPSIAGVQKDSDAAYRWLTSAREKDLIPPEQVILFGESLGGALAVDLASREPIAAVVLESTFTSLRELAANLYPFVPSAIVPDVYRSHEAIRHLKSPVLVIHGTADELVPFSMGEALFQKAPHPKRFYEVKGALHKDCYLRGGKDYLQQIENFLNEAGL